MLAKYTKEVVPVVSLTISMFYMIRLWILHNLLPVFFGWEVCYIYFLCRSKFSTTPALYFVSIDTFAHNITVPEFICQYILYNIIIGCNSYWGFYTLYIICMGYSTSALLLNMRFNSYVCEYYIYVYCNVFVYFTQSNTWWYSNLGKIVVHIYWFILPLLPSSLARIKIFY